MVWAVVSFVKENTVEVVPSSWYIKESEECFWPPSSFNTSKLVRLINNSADPESDWKCYSATLLGEYETLEVANKKAQKAEYTNELSSQSDAGRGFRKVKKNPKYSQTNSSSEDGSEENISSDDDNIYPTFRPHKGVYKSICPTSNKAIENSDERKKSKVGRNMAESSAQFQEHPSCSRINKNPVKDLLAADQKEALSEDFKKKILYDLSLINLKLDSIMDRLISSSSSGPDMTQRQNVEQFYARIPLKSEQDLNEIENWLEDKNNYQIAVTELSRVGGTSVAQTTRKIMYKIFCNELAMSFSWEGMKSKKVFKNLSVSKCILHAMRICFKESTEAEVIAVIKVWLVKAKERLKNQNIEQDNQ